MRRSVWLKWLITSALLCSLGMQQATAEECPLDLALTGSPEALLQKLKALPAMDSERKTESKPLFGHCDYKVSTFMQFSAAPGGMCTIAGEPVVASATELVDSAATVSGQSYAVPLSDDSFGALKKALGKIASLVSPENYPQGLNKRTGYWLTDAVFARNDDYWIISHEHWEPGEAHTAPGIYTLLHVRRPWLAFATRDLNKCTALPATQ